MVQITKHGEPALRALAIAVLDGHELLLAILADADQDQRAQPILFEPDPEVDAIGEEVRVPLPLEGPLAELLVVVLPTRGQARDGRRRKTGCSLFTQE
jgi:hypothetical protein